MLTTIFLYFKITGIIKKEVVLIMRKILRDRIREVYATQDKCAYALKIDSAILSRIVGCTKDPTDAQMELLCKFLSLTAGEVNEKDE